MPASLAPPYRERRIGNRRTGHWRTNFADNGPGNYLAFRRPSTAQQPVTHFAES